MAADSPQTSSHGAAVAGSGAGRRRLDIRAFPAARLGWGNVASQRLGEAPIHDASGKLTGMVVVEVLYITSNPRQLVQEVLAAFGIITVLGIMATAIPILAVSFLFAYFVARRFTRRLEDVSQVATSIAAGDLTQRAPTAAGTRSPPWLITSTAWPRICRPPCASWKTPASRRWGALKSRQMLVASISHELRTPLAVVRAHLEALLERRPAAVGVGGGSGGDADGEITAPPATLQALQNETERLASLVDDLFTLSRAQTGAIQVTVQPVDVAALVDDVAALMARWRSGKGRSRSPCRPLPACHPPRPIPTACGRSWKTSSAMPCATPLTAASSSSPLPRRMGR